MHVLTQQMLLGGLEYDELLPLWAKRMKVILTPPPLFESIKLARTERGVTWHVIETAKLVAADNGLVAVATGKDTTYTVLDRGSKLQGALCPLWQDVGLSAAVRHSAGPHSLHAHRYFHQGSLLQARLVVALDGKHVHVKHNCGDSPTYLQQHPELAQTATKRQRTQHRSLPPSRASPGTPSQAASSTMRPTEPPYPPLRRGRLGVGMAGDRGAHTATAKAGTLAGQANGPAITEVVIWGILPHCPWPSTADLFGASCAVE